MNTHLSGSFLIRVDLCSSVVCFSLVGALLLVGCTGEHIYEICQVGLLTWRNLRTNRTGAAIFSGVKEWNRLPASHQSPGVLLWIHRRGDRMADCFFDHFERSEAISTDDDPVSLREIQLRDRSLDLVLARPDREVHPGNRNNRHGAWDALRDFI